MRLSIVCIVSMLLLAGCGQEPNPIGPDLSIITGHDDSPCASPGHEEFDFWLGRWTIADAASGTAAGVSEITSGLGGCIVEESFFAANGARGRSLNVYDRDERRWYQTFVGVFGQNFRIAGSRTTAAAMFMTGRRATFQGSNPARITWTIAAGTVRQLVENSFDGGNTFVTGFDGIYSPVTVITPPAPLLPGICPNVAVFRQFDFALGDWSIEKEDGEVIGQSRIQADLNQCLLEERVTGGTIPSSVSYFFFDLGTGTWIRAFGDDEGRHLELTGGPDATGGFAYGQALGRRTIRNRWIPRPDGTMLQSWEAEGGGVPAPRTVVYRPLP